MADDRPVASILVSFMGWFRTNLIFKLLINFFHIRVHFYFISDVLYIGIYAGYIEPV